MKRRRYKDVSRRKKFNKMEIFQRLIKVLIFFSCFELLQKVLKSKSLIFQTQIRNFCVLTKRPRGVFRHLKVSRICLKNLGNTMFFGLKRASW